MNDSCQYSPSAEEVRRITVKYVRIWNELPNVAPQFNRQFTHSQQRENENRLTQQFQKLPGSYTVYDTLSDEHKAHISLDVMKAVAGSSILSRTLECDGFFQESERVTRKFMDEARSFDPSLRESDLHQALRNLWVFNSLQLFSGKKIVLTPSSIAYSLLYPYVDNGLDSAARTDDEKGGLIRWLTMWFMENGCTPIDELTEKIDRLLCMISEEYPRKEFPEVHRSLLAILIGQQKSLLLQSNHPELTDEELTEATVEKGGTSVLADGYLAAGTLTLNSADAVFEYGVVLQLIDDLQDLEEDMTARHITPFQRIAERRELEGVTMRLFSLVKRCGSDLKNESAGGIGPLQQLVDDSCTFLIMDAVAQNSQFYSKAFLRAIEPYTPLRREYLKEMRLRMKATSVDKLMDATEQSAPVSVESKDQPHPAWILGKSTKPYRISKPADAVG